MRIIFDELSSYLPNKITWFSPSLLLLEQKLAGLGYAPQPRWWFLVDSKCFSKLLPLDFATTLAEWGVAGRVAQWAKMGVEAT